MKKWCTAGELARMTRAEVISWGDLLDGIEEAEAIEADKVPRK